MKIIYAKSVLYAYRGIETIKKQIDEYIEKKALASMNDYSPCDEQCEDIIEHMAQKVILTQLKSKARAVLISLKKEELDLLDYKYFKSKPKSYFENVDTTSRSYYRRQSNLIKKVSHMFDKATLTDEWFEKYCLNINLFKWLLKRVEKQEESARRDKNKKNKTEKNQKKNKDKKGDKSSSFMMSA